MLDRVELSLEKIIYTPHKETIARLILAHGAGAGNRHEFMESFASQLAKTGIEVHSINFPYMQMAYELDKKRPPNANAQLAAYYKSLVLELSSDLPLFIAGKSMGGRIASQILTDKEVEEKVSGCFVLGYPFTPPGKPEKLPDRTKHFSDIKTPVLILQGERDTFGSKELLSKITLPKVFSVEWITSGDHSFKPLKKSGVTLEDNIESAVMLANRFIQEQY